MTRDWVDYINLVFNGLSVLVAGGAFAFAIISFNASQRAKETARAAQQADAHTRAFLDRAARLASRSAPTSGAPPTAEDIELSELAARYPRDDTGSHRGNRRRRDQDVDRPPHPPRDDSWEKLLADIERGTDPPRH